MGQENIHRSEEGTNLSLHKTRNREGPPTASNASSQAQREKDTPPRASLSRSAADTTPQPLQRGSSAGSRAGPGHPGSGSSASRGGNLRLEKGRDDGAAAAAVGLVMFVRTCGFRSPDKKQYLVHPADPRLRLCDYRPCHEKRRTSAAHRALREALFSALRHLPRR